MQMRSGWWPEPMWCPGFGWPRGVEGVIADGRALEKREVMEADGPIELVSVPAI